MRHSRPTLLLGALLLGAGAGCTLSDSPVPPPAGKPSAPSRPAKGEDADNPLVKEARPDTEAVLDDLLASRTHGDSMLARLSQKVAGYRSWTIEGQVVAPDDRKAVTFDGTLKGPSGDAGFRVHMVKQRVGGWMIGYFEGPYPK